MKINKIYEVFSAKVSQYLSEGYTIHLSTMVGSQGELGKVDLYKGEELIRIWLIREYKSFARRADEMDTDKVVLRVGKWIHPLNPKRVGIDETGWMSDFSIIEEIKYYQIDRRGNWYLEDFEEACAAYRVNHSRLHNRIDIPAPDRLDSAYATEIAVRYLKRVQRYKRVSRDYVSVLKTVRDGVATYKVRYNGHAYTLK